MGDKGGADFENDIHSLSIPLYSISEDELKSTVDTTMSPEKQMRLFNWTKRVSSSQRVGVVYSLSISCACLVTICLILVFSKELPADLRIWLGCVNTVLIVAFQIMTAVFRNDPVFAWHFMYGLSLFTGCGFMLSALHLIC